MTSDETMILYAPNTSDLKTEQDVIASFFASTPRGFFLDVGAFDGLCYSNTRALWERGWSGVLLEPDPDTFKRLEEAYPRGARDRVRLINAALAKADGVAQFAQHTDPQRIGWHSLDPRWIATWPPGTARYINVLTVSWASLALPAEIDLLSVDTEGMDYEIIAAMPETLRPRLIVAEVDKMGVREHLDAEMERRAYRFVWGNYLNSIYARA